MSDERLTVGSLFTGIGGFDLGLERAGMRIVWQCEQDEFCRRVLARHWPGVPCHPDVRALVADAALNGRGPGGAGRPDPDGSGQLESALQADVPVPMPYVDVLCAGWPCPGFSVAGRGEGFNHAGSGLWTEIIRLVPDLRPRYVVLENVSALRSRGLGRVLGDLAACGYDAEWDCIPACAVGAPHRRDRVWIVAYPDADGRRLEVSRERDGDTAQPGLEAPFGHNADGLRAPTGAVADAAGARRGSARPVGPAETAGSGAFGEPARSGGWAVEPGVGRVAHGIPDRVDRLRALGNALLPQIAEWLGQRIVAHEQEARQAEAAGVA